MKYDYHDATLKNLNVDWVVHTVTVVFQLYSEESRFVCMTMTDVYDMYCPHKAPWGESVSVNSVSITRETPGETNKVEIEMQSGDVIVIKGKNISEEDK